jgi:small subunit ribosomal protein S2
MRAIHLYSDLVSGAVLDGLQAELAASGVDIGASAELPEAAVPELDEGAEFAEADMTEAAQPEAVPAAE